MITDLPLLRYMLLSALIGFIVFCGSYAVLVWKKRRSSPSKAASTLARLRGWSVTGIVVGCMGLMFSLAIREAVRSDGIMTGDGLYAVRATPDMQIVTLVPEGANVKEGDVIARFMSNEAQSEINKAELDLEQLKSQRENLSLQPLPRDPELVRQHNLAEARELQLLSNLKNARDARETASRENRPHVLMHRDLVANINAEMKKAAGDVKAAIVKRDIAEQQLVRETALNKNMNTSLTELNERQKEVGSLKVDVVKFEAHLAAMEERLKTARESLAKMEKEAEEQDQRLAKDIKGTESQLAAAEKAKKDIDYQLNEDQATAFKRHEWAKSNQEILIRQAEVALQGKQNRLEHKAPFSGNVIYRHASPGTALNQGTVLVLSRPDSMRGRFRVPENQTDALAKAGTVTVDLEENGQHVEQRFPAKFLSAVPLTREPGMAMVDLDCQAPPETVASLAEGKAIKLHFSWRPPLMTMWPFPISLALIGLGMLGLVISSIAGWKPDWRVEKPDEESDDVMVTLTRFPANKDGDTEEARHDTIPVRPDLPHIPREKPVQPWEHPVGVRLREAIVREDLSSELMDAVETAIERQKDGVINPMREALKRVPSVPDHARQLLNSLNNFETHDEMKMIEKRCLAQRLTFLLYTLGFEIPSEVAEVK